MGSRGDTKIHITKRGQAFVEAHGLGPEGYRFTTDCWTNWVCPAARCRLCEAPLSGRVRVRYLQFNRPHYWEDRNYRRGPRRRDLVYRIHVCETCWVQG